MQPQREQNKPTTVELCKQAAAAFAAALLLASSAPAYAELQTVTTDQATQMAKPLKQQKVNKGKVWMLLIFGASALFGVTIVFENNEKFFPAIARANRAMTATMKAMEAAQQAPPPPTMQQRPPMPPQIAADEAVTTDIEVPVVDRSELEAAVLAGIQSASQKQRREVPQEDSEETTNTSGSANEAHINGASKQDSTEEQQQQAEGKDGDGEVSAVLNRLDVEQLERELQKRKAAVGNEE